MRTDTKVIIWLIAIHYIGIFAGELGVLDGGWMKVLWALLAGVTIAFSAHQIERWYRNE